MDFGRADHVESRGNEVAEVAVRCLNAAIDESGVPRKALAREAGISEAQFSKLVRSAALDLVDRLPDEIVTAWLDRMGHQRGFEVRVLAPERLDAEVLNLLEQLTTVLRLRKVRTRPAKAGLPAASERRAVS